LGKTSGRGHKGQRARSGGTVREGFEGGQMPLHRRLPKRGFNNADHTIYYIPVNVSDLERFDANAVVDLEALRKAGLASGKGQGIKILGHGELSKKLTVKVQAFSASAKQKIEAAGGACEVVDRIPKTGPRAL
jgi:large subunit ribosomal protein L15